MHSFVQWLEARTSHWQSRLVIAVVLTVVTVVVAIILKTSGTTQTQIAQADEKQGQRPSVATEQQEPTLAPGALPLNQQAKPLLPPEEQVNPTGEDTPRVNPLRSGPATRPPVEGANRTMASGVTSGATLTTGSQQAGSVSSGSSGGIKVLPPPPQSVIPAGGEGSFGRWVVPDDPPANPETAPQTPLPAEVRDATARSGLDQSGQPPVMGDDDIPDAAEVLPTQPAAAQRDSGPAGLSPTQTTETPDRGEPTLAPGTTSAQRTGTQTVRDATPQTTENSGNTLGPTVSQSGPRLAPVSGPPQNTLANPFDRLPPPATGSTPTMISPPPTRSPLPLTSTPAASDGFGASSASSGESTSLTAAGAEGEARPGDATLEGPQTPQVTVQKILPSEVQVGKPASSRIVVRNSGAIPISKIEVQDPIPWGVRVLRTTPQAAQQSQGMLIWNLGPMKPGDEIALEAEIMPLQEGELGSVVTVLVHAQASARTKSTRPQLVLKTQMPPQAMIGDEVLVTISISNTGSGVASNVVLEERVPPEMQHPAGSELENVLGDLRPGETRQVQLRLRAARPGTASNRLIARADGNIRVEDVTHIAILAPQIDLVVEGPARRFLDRESTYQIALTNNGSAAARMVRLTAALPAGLQFVRANNAGSYDPTTHSVQWLLEELPVQQTGRVELVVRPIAAGEQTLSCTVRDELGLGTEQRLAIQVEGISALNFHVADSRDPVEVGGETVYEIRVVNQGTKEATNVQVMVSLPDGVRPLAGEGPTANTVNGSEVLFEKLPRLAARGEAIFRVRAQATQPGDQRVRVQVLSDDIRLPITKEESTQVYADTP